MDRTHAFLIALTWDVPVTILQGMEVIHELLHWDLKDSKETSIFK